MKTVVISVVVMTIVFLACIALTELDWRLRTAATILIIAVLVTGIILGIANWRIIKPWPSR